MCLCVCVCEREILMLFSVDVMRDERERCVYMCLSVCV